MDSLKPTAANSCPLTPLTFLERAAVVYADSPSVVYNTATYTWSATNRRCLQAASAIVSLGIRPGQVVSVISPNVPAAYELHFAVPMAGAILNNINTRLNSTTISALLNHSDSKLVFVYHRLQSVVVDALSLLPPEHPRPRLVLISDDDHDSDQPTSDFCSTYEGLIESGDVSEFDWVRPKSEWDPIVLNYTSGTTASPKGVVHSHRGTFVMSVDSLIDWSMPKQPVLLWTLPMFHSNGWSFPWAMAAVGGTNICLSRFDGPTLHAAIRCHKVTHMCAAPVVLNMLVDAKPHVPLQRPVHVLTGGAPPPAPVLLKMELLGFVVSHGYGMSETGTVVISCAWKSEWNTLPPMERASLKALQGVRTIGLNKVDIIDRNSRKSLPRDGKTVGEIAVQGASVMLGYLKDQEATSKCLGDDGWLLTGDLGVIHPNGYLEIKDRSKDIIISGGENISSVEVESVLYTIPGVNEAAVVAQPHKHWGETPCAFLGFTKGVEVKLIESEVIEFCRKKLAHYMVPKRVVFLEELPKTSTGKIQKFRLREMAKAMLNNPLLETNKIV
ncbi:hypothetical protein RND81_03G093900 [Saponaria officinalis]|uniref:4-coumarate--CoA ligase n=1 Tax=Saponaria officinalis TaxID=3572 RepID=A0AAW1LZL0_SAPOF